MNAHQFPRAGNATVTMNGENPWEIARKKTKGADEYKLILMILSKWHIGQQ